MCGHPGHEGHVLRSSTPIIGPCSDSKEAVASTCLISSDLISRDMSVGSGSWKAAAARRSFIEKAHAWRGHRVEKSLRSGSTQYRAWAALRCVGFGFSRRGPFDLALPCRDVAATLPAVCCCGLRVCFPRPPRRTPGGPLSRICSAAAKANGPDLGNTPLRRKTEGRRRRARPRCRRCNVSARL